MYYNVGKNPGFICPKKQHGKDCPVCNFAWHIYNEAKTNNDAETLKLAKSLFPKKRFFSPVVVRGEEDQGDREEALSVHRLSHHPACAEGEGEGSL